MKNYTDWLTCRAYAASLAAAWMRRQAHRARPWHVRILEHHQFFRFFMHKAKLLQKAGKI